MTQPPQFAQIGPSDLDLLARVDPLLDGRSPEHRQHIGDLLGGGTKLGRAGSTSQAAGYAVVTRHFFNFPFVDLLVVDEARRRWGIGEALMAQCERSHDADRIFTSTTESNAPMRRLLVKSDWAVSGLIENLDPGDPEVVFVKFRVPG